MLDSSGHEQQVPGTEAMTLGAVSELTSSLEHHVDFVSGVRRLRVSPARGVQLY
jgi:hypothetical protein